MTEDRDRNLIDKEEQIEAYAKMLGETPKKRNLPEMTPDKKDLVDKILWCRNHKDDMALSHAKRVEIEDFSFDCYEKLLALCDGDSDLVKRLLGERLPHRVKDTDVLEP